VPLVPLYLHSNALVGSLNELVRALPALDEQQRPTRAELEQLLAAAGQDWQSHEAQLERALEQAGRAREARERLLWCAAALAACACLRLCRDLRASPRLQVFLRALQAAAQDLAHMLVVFGAVLLAFALTGHVIYGGSVEAC